MSTTLRDPTARLLESLSHRLRPRTRNASPRVPNGFTLRSDRGRGTFLRDRTSGDRSDLAS